jgi:hypothetical protein
MQTPGKRLVRIWNCYVEYQTGQLLNEQIQIQSKIGRMQGRYRNSDWVWAEFSQNVQRTDQQTLNKIRLFNVVF